MVARVHETIDVFTAHVVRLHLCGCLVQYIARPLGTAPHLRRHSGGALAELRRVGARAQLPRSSAAAARRGGVAKAWQSRRGAAAESRQSRGEVAARRYRSFMAAIPRFTANRADSSERRAPHAFVQANTQQATRRRQTAMPMTCMTRAQTAQERTRANTSNKSANTIEK